MTPYASGKDWTLYHGDCLKVLPTLTGVDAVVTDPPYGISYASNHTAPTTTARWMNTQIANDATTSARDAVLGWAGDLPWCAFGSLKAPAPLGTRTTLVWDKGPASGMGDLSLPWKPSFEVVFIGGKGWKGRRDEGVLKGFHVVTRASMGRVHPNEKPVSVMQHIIEKLPPECTVLDPFFGSCSTGVACIKTGRKFIGIELDDGYCEIAARRMREAESHLFAEVKP